MSRELVVVLDFGGQYKQLTSHAECVSAACTAKSIPTR